MILRCALRQLDLSEPVVMGVLNVTPDSFSDGGRFATLELSVLAARQMVEQGAAIIDIGGESTRPGAHAVSLGDELARTMPVIDALRELPVVLSIDTSKPEVMHAALERGVGMVNDVRALREPGALAAVAGSNAAVCLMHMLGEPRSMQQAPSYAHVVSEVRAFLAERAQACIAAGIDAARIAIDPGFGFGKTVDHNLQLLAELQSLESLGYPLLVGLSRKSMIGTLTGRPPGERLAASLALALLAVERGARIVRAHDVAATVDVLRVRAALRRQTEPTRESP